MGGLAKKTTFVVPSLGLHTGKPSMPQDMLSVTTPPVGPILFCSIGPTSHISSTIHPLCRLLVANDLASTRWQHSCPGFWISFGTEEEEVETRHPFLCVSHPNYLHQVHRWFLCMCWSAKDRVSKEIRFFIVGFRTWKAFTLSAIQYSLYIHREMSRNYPVSTFFLGRRVFPILWSITGSIKPPLSL